MQDIETVVKEIQQGNESLREELITSQKPFIHRYTSFICKRGLDWLNDDELSIALIAYNNALDKYETGKGKNFPAYARVLIKNSLIDFFRSQPGISPVSLDREDDGSPAREEEEVSRVFYLQELENRDRAFELELFKRELSAFGLDLAELPAFSPRHRDTREYLKSTARKISGSDKLVSRIYRDKKLPLKEVQAYTGTARKTLEKWRKYLLALIIILTNPHMGILAEYIEQRSHEK